MRACCALQSESAGVQSVPHSVMRDYYINFDNFVFLWQTQKGTFWCDRDLATLKQFLGCYNECIYEDCTYAEW
jgi:hypothetical protein